MLNAVRKKGVNGNLDLYCAGKSKGGVSTKVHVSVNSQGLPVSIIFTPGQRNEITVAESAVVGSPDEVLADKAYDSDEFVEYLQDLEIEAVIPPRKNRTVLRPYNKEKYKKRHLVENFFGKIKAYRRVATRYDQTISSFSGFVLLAATLLWIK